MGNVRPRYNAAPSQEPRARIYKSNTSEPCNDRGRHLPLVRFTRTTRPVSYTHLTLPTTPYV